jgi:hypothetical protein
MKQNFSVFSKKIQIMKLSLTFKCEYAYNKHIKVLSVTVRQLIVTQKSNSYLGSAVAFLISIISSSLHDTDYSYNNRNCCNNNTSKTDCQFNRQIMSLSSYFPWQSPPKLLEVLNYVKPATGEPLPLG